MDLEAPFPRLEGRAAQLAEVLQRADKARWAYSKWMRMVHGDEGTAEEMEEAEHAYNDAELAHLHALMQLA